MSTQTASNDEEHLSAAFSTVTLESPSKSPNDDIKVQSDQQSPKGFSGDQEKSQDSYDEAADLFCQIETQLTKCDYPANWILDRAYFENDAKMVYGIICDKLMELEGTKDEANQAELKNNVFDAISKKLTQVFLAIHLKKYDKADQHLNEARALVTKCVDNDYLDKRYADGIRRPFDALEGLLMISLPRAASALESVRAMKNLLVDVEGLDDLGDVGQLAIHSCFIGHVYKRNYDDQRQLINKMIKLEPTCGQWKLWLHNIYRFERREQWRSSPGAEEKSLIIEAAKLDSDNAMILIALCDTLAEVLRDLGPKWRGSLDFGPERRFRTSQEIVEYLSKATRDVLDLDPTSVRSNISVAQIFSVVLPKPFRDYVFAKLCIDRALLFHPSSSKANQRAGIYYLQIKEDIGNAIKYFEHAVEADPRNFPAVSDLIQAYMSNCSKNAEKIEHLLDSASKDLSLSDASVGRLYFMRGIYHLIKDESDAVVDNWESAVKNNCELEQFKKLSYFNKRYFWPSEKLTEGNLTRILTAAVRNASTAERKNVLEKILLAIRNGFGERSEFRRGGRGGRGQGHRGGRGSQNWRGGFGDRGFGGGFEDFFGRGSGFEDFFGFNDFFGRGKRSSGSGDHSGKSHHGTGTSSGSGSGQREERGFRKPTPEDLFSTLGISAGACSDEITKAYRKMCLKHHPDKNGHLVGKEKEDNLEFMKRINTAYETLVKKNR